VQYYTTLYLPCPLQARIPGIPVRRNCRTAYLPARHVPRPQEGINRLLHPAPQPRGKTATHTDTGTIPPKNPVSFTSYSLCKVLLPVLRPPTALAVMTASL